VRCNLTLRWYRANGREIASLKKEIAFQPRRTPFVGAGTPIPRLGGQRLRSMEQGLPTVMEEDGPLDGYDTGVEGNPNKRPRLENGPDVGSVRPQLARLLYSPTGTQRKALPRRRSSSDHGRPAGWVLRLFRPPNSIDSPGTARRVRPLAAAALHGSRISKMCIRRSRDRKAPSGRLARTWGTLVLMLFRRLYS
jgi:hypothetical protein